MSPVSRTESLRLSLPPGTRDSWNIPPHRRGTVSVQVRSVGLRRYQSRVLSRKMPLTKIGSSVSARTRGKSASAVRTTSRSTCLSPRACSSNARVSIEKLYPPRLRARSVRRGPSRWSPVPFPRTPIDEHRAWGDRRLRHHGSDPLPHAGEGALPSVRALRGERRHVPKEGRPPRPPRTGGRHIRPRGHRRPRVWCGGARQLDPGTDPRPDGLTGGPTRADDGEGAHRPMVVHRRPIARAHRIGPFEPEDSDAGVRSRRLGWCGTHLPHRTERRGPVLRRPRAHRYRVREARVRLFPTWPRPPRLGVRPPRDWVRRRPRAGTGSRGSPGEHVRDLDPGRGRVPDRLGVGASIRTGVVLRGCWKLGARFPAFRLSPKGPLWVKTASLRCGRSLKSRTVPQGYNPPPPPLPAGTAVGGAAKKR